ncbi:MAG: exonuclease domain-containing protein, partial [Bacteroidota bacterium]
MGKINLQEILIKETDFSVLDFETTGTSAKHGRVIEVGITRVKNNKILDSYQSFINPGMNIPPFITSLTGISNNDVYDAPFFDEITGDILDFIGESVITAHNLPFDYSFLKNELKRAELQLPENHTLCTLKLARKLYPELKSKSLGNLVKHFRIRHKNVHRALGDSNVTAKLLIKMLTQLEEDYNITKLEELLSYQSATPIKSGYRIIKKKMSSDYASLPSSSGVYLFKNSKGEAIYIGKAKVLKQRVANYFSSSAVKKSKKIVRRSSKIEYIKTNSELSALILESELIKELNPPLNTLLKKYPQQYFIRINKSNDYPDLKSTSKFDFDGNDYFGPYSNRETAKNLIDIVDKTFMLRECSDKELMKKKKCYLYDIKRCLAPCINESNKLYKNELLAAYDFLSGGNQNIVDKLLNKMKTLSDERKYEEAAEIRDIVNQILNQLNRASILAEPVNKANALVEIDSFDKKDHLLFLEGKVIIKNLKKDEPDLNLLIEE